MTSTLPTTGGHGASTLRRDLLLRLRVDGPSTPDQLATRLGASRTGVLQQLRALEMAGLVSRQTIRHGVGRPRHQYDVTKDARVTEGCLGLVTDLAATWREAAMQAVVTGG